MLRVQIELCARNYHAGNVITGWMWLLRTRFDAAGAPAVDGAPSEPLSWHMQPIADRLRSEAIDCVPTAVMLAVNSPFKMTQAMAVRLETNDPTKHVLIGALRREDNRVLLMCPVEPRPAFE